MSNTIARNINWLVQYGHFATALRLAEQECSIMIGDSYYFPDGSILTFLE